MEVKEQIRAYRSSLGLSQEELAEAVYVTRQTVSNWETGKSYPDIQSLLRLSAFFGVSLDQLIKGDAERMKEKINDDEIRAFNRLSNVFALMMVLSLLVWAPLAYFLHWWGMALAVILFAFTFFLALRVEKEKRNTISRAIRRLWPFWRAAGWTRSARPRKWQSGPTRKYFSLWEALLLPLC